MKCVCLRSWRESRRLAKRLVASVLLDEWQAASEWAEHDEVAIERDMFVISVKAARIRALDRLHVYHRGQEVWFPPLSRYCVRAAVRLRITKQAAATVI